MEAGIGYQRSYLWRSFLAARELVKDGVAWRVGNGKSISIAQDGWVRVTHSRKTSCNLPGAGPI